MAVSSSIPPVALLQALMFHHNLEAMAQAAGFLKRRRTILPIDFLYTLIAAPPPREGVSIAALWKQFCALTGHTVARSSFSDRFGPTLDLWLMRLLQQVTTTIQRRPCKLSGPLSFFTDVIARDATVIAVHSGLRWVWRGTRKHSPASLKVHTDVRVFDGGLLHYHLTPGNTHDIRGMPTTNWTAGALYLLDRGYTATAYWVSLATANAFFLTPLRSTFDPKIQVVHSATSSSMPSLAGTALREQLWRWWGKTLDVDAEFWVRKPPHAQRLYAVTFRMVGVWNVNTKKHHLYVTNVPRTVGTPRQLGDWYRLRWEVEVAYKVGKSGLGLGELPSQQQPVVQSLIRAALLRGVVASQARRLAEHHLETGWINPVMWVRSWPGWLWDALRGFSIARTQTSEDAWNYMAKMTRDANGKHRIPTRIMVQQATEDTS